MDIATHGLASSAFARHYLRNLVWFLFLRLLRCFSSAGSPDIPMYSVYHRTAFPVRSFLIRISPDLSLFAAPRSFSQLVTSFIGSYCQGILLVLFLAWTSFWFFISLHEFRKSGFSTRNNCSSDSFESNTLFQKDSNLVIIFSSVLHFSICFFHSLFSFQSAFESFDSWWAQVDSNHRPCAYQAHALTTWAMSP